VPRENTSDEIIYREKRCEIMLLYRMYGNMKVLLTYYVYIFIE